MNEIIEASVRDSDVVANEINVLTKQAKSMALHFIIEIGHRLIEAKNMVNHGEWGKWLAEKVEYSQSTAENFMRIAEEYGSKQVSFFEDCGNSQAFEKLEYTKLLSLIAVPKEQRAEFAKQVDAENISTRELQDKIKELTAEKEKQERDASSAAKRLEELSASFVEKEREIEDLRSQINDLEAEERDVPKHEMDRIRAEIAAEEKKKASEKLSSLSAEKTALEEKLKKAEADLKNEKTVAKDKAVKEQAAITSERDRYKEQAVKLEKQLALAGDDNVVKFRVHFEAFQRELAAAEDSAAVVKDHAVREKLLAAVRTVFERKLER